MSWAVKKKLEHEKSRKMYFLFKVLPKSYCDVQTTENITF